jgi:hypothetical protein
MKGPRRLYPHAPDALCELLDLFNTFTPIPKMSVREHAELQRERGQEMLDGVRRAMLLKVEYTQAQREGLSVSRLRAAMRAAVESSLNAQITHNLDLRKGEKRLSYNDIEITDLRRGEKCVSLRHTARPVSVTTGPGAAVHSKRRREDK